MTWMAKVSCFVSYNKLLFRHKLFYLSYLFAKQPSNPPYIDLFLSLQTGSVYCWTISIFISVCTVTQGDVKHPPGLDVNCASLCFLQDRDPLQCSRGRCPVQNEAAVAPSRGRRRRAVLTRVATAQTTST